MIYTHSSLTKITDMRDGRLKKIIICTVTFVASTSLRILFLFMASSISDAAVTCKWT